MDEHGEASNSFANDDCPQRTARQVRRPLWRLIKRFRVPSSEYRAGNTQNSDLRPQNSELRTQNSLVTQNTEHLRARYIHRGSVLHSLLMFTCGALLLGTAAVILDPQSLQAVSKPPENLQAAEDRRSEFAKTLAGLIGDCTEVLAIHERSDTPCVDVVLWVDDDLNPGVIDPHEIAIISQSQLFRTITVYSVEGPGKRFQSQQHRVPSAEHRVESTQNSELRTQNSLGTALDRATVSTPQFCDRWRAQPTVEPQVIATGISDMRLERLPGAHGELSVIRLSLRWGADSTDGAGEASALIDTGVRSPK